MNSPRVSSVRVGGREADEMQVLNENRHGGGRNGSARIRCSGCASLKTQVGSRWEGVVPGGLGLELVLSGGLPLSLSPGLSAKRAPAAVRSPGWGHVHSRRGSCGSIACDRVLARLAVPSMVSRSRTPTRPPPNKSSQPGRRQPGSQAATAWRPVNPKSRVAGEPIGWGPARASGLREEVCRTVGGRGGGRLCGVGA